jgi:hypothetical protein
MDPENWEGSSAKALKKAMSFFYHQLPVFYHLSIEGRFPQIWLLVRQARRTPKPLSAAAIYGADFT